MAKVVFKWISFNLIGFLLSGKTSQTKYLPGIEVKLPVGNLCYDSSVLRQIRDL